MTTWKLADSQLVENLVTFGLLWRQIWAWLCQTNTAKLALKKVKQIKW